MNLISNFQIPLKFNDPNKNEGEKKEKHELGNHQNTNCKL